MTNNSYTLYFQNLYDVMINEGVPEELQNKDGDMVYSYFPSVEKRMELTSRGLSGSGNYALFSKGLQ